MRRKLVLGRVSELLVPHEVKKDADLPLLRSLVLLPVYLDSGSMRQEKVMAGDVRFGGRIPTEPATSASARGKEAVTVAVRGHHPGLIDGKPVLHPVTVCLKAEVCKGCKITPAKRRVININHRIIQYRSMQK